MDCAMQLANNSRQLIGCLPIQQMVSSTELPSHIETDGRPAAHPEDNEKFTVVVVAASSPKTTTTFSVTQNTVVSISMIWTTELPSGVSRRSSRIDAHATFHFTARPRENDGRFRPWYTLWITSCCCCCVPTSCAPFIILSHTTPSLFFLFAWRSILFNHARLHAVYKTATPNLDASSSSSSSFLKKFVYGRGIPRRSLSLSL